MACSSSSSSSFRSVIAIVLLFALIFESSSTHHTRVAAEVDPLLPTCKSVGGGSTFFDVDFCMSALGSDGRSRHAKNDRDLASVAVDLLTANATATADKIDGLIRVGSGRNDTTSRRLLSCQALYVGVLGRQPACAAAVKGGRLAEARSSLEQSASAVTECETGFGKSRVASPLTAEDDNAFKLAKLGVALLRFAP